MSITEPSGTMSPSVLRTLSCLTVSASTRKGASAWTLTCQVRPVVHRLVAAAVVVGGRLFARPAQDVDPLHQDSTPPGSRQVSRSLLPRDLPRAGGRRI